MAGWNNSARQAFEISMGDDQPVPGENRTHGGALDWRGHLQFIQEQPRTYKFAGCAVFTVIALVLIMMMRARQVRYDNLEDALTEYENVWYENGNPWKATRHTDAKFGLVPDIKLEDNAYGKQVGTESVTESSWADQIVHVEPGDVVLEMNGKATRGISKHDFWELAKQRPLEIQFGRFCSFQVMLEFPSSLDASTIEEKLQNLPAFKIGKDLIGGDLIFDSPQWTKSTETEDKVYYQGIMEVPLDREKLGQVLLASPLREAFRSMHANPIPMLRSSSDSLQTHKLYVLAEDDNGAPVILGDQLDNALDLWRRRLVGGFPGYVDDLKTCKPDPIESLDTLTLPHVRISATMTIDVRLSAMIRKEAAWIWKDVVKDFIKWDGPFTTSAHWEKESLGAKC